MNSFPAYHYDGRTADRHRVILVPEGAGFRLDSETMQQVVGASPGEQGTFGQCNWTDLRWIETSGSAATFVHGERPGWRIVFPEGVPAEFAGMVGGRPSRYGGWIDRIGLWRAAGIFTAVSACAVAVGVMAPQWLAPLVPLSVEKQLGDLLLGDMQGRVCTGKGAQAALDALVQRVEPGKRDVQVRVINIDIVNAFALPGGTVLVFRGLLEDARSPDEVAGVIGHEVGHVRHRDVMASLLRQLGLSVVLGGSNTDLTSVGQTLLSTSYSRSAEEAADAYAINRLREADISPRGAAAFFERLAKQEEFLGKARNILSYMSSHPLSEERRRAFLNGVQPEARYRPALDPQQWQALKEGCASDPHVQPTDFFL